MKKLKELYSRFFTPDCISSAQLILKHSFPNGKDENYMPKFRMTNPDCDYVMNMELTKVIKIVEINN